MNFENSNLSSSSTTPTMLLFLLRISMKSWPNGWLFAMISRFWYSRLQRDESWLLELLLESCHDINYKNQSWWWFKEESLLLSLPFYFRQLWKVFLVKFDSILIQKNMFWCALNQLLLYTLLHHWKCKLIQSKRLS